MKFFGVLSLSDDGRFRTEPAAATLLLLLLSTSTPLSLLTNPFLTITLTITITTTISTGTNIAKGLLPGASNKVSNEMVGRSLYGFEHYVSEYDVNGDQGHKRLKRFKKNILKNGDENYFNNVDPPKRVENA